MTTPNASAGGASNPPSGSAAGSGDETPPAGSTPVKKDPVAWDDHQRALKDMLRFKTEKQTLNGKVQALEAQLEDLTTKVATKERDFESLYSREKTGREAAESEKKKLLENVVRSERYRAIYPVLKKAGLRDDADNFLEHLDMSSLEVEATSSGRFVVSGMDSFVDEVKKTHPYVFASPKPPKVNGSSGNGLPTPERWTPQTLDALERNCKKKGDMTPFRTAFAEYLKQKQAPS